MTYPTRWHIRVKLLGLLLLAGIIALLAGPSSAILMLPRAQDWSSTDSIYLPGDTDTFWPEAIAADNPGIRKCSVDDASYRDTCLTTTYNKLLTLFADDFIRGPFNVPLSLVSQDVARYISGSVRRIANPGSQSWTLAPHLATCFLQSAIFTQWASIYFYSRQQNHAAELPARPNVVSAKVPVSRVVCIPPTLLDNTTTTAIFPVLQEFDHYVWRNEATYMSNGIVDDIAPVMKIGMRNEIKHLRNAIADANDEEGVIIRSAWVSLPPSLGVSSSGLAIMMSADSTSTQPALMGCSIDMRYADGYVSTEGSTYVLGETTLQSTALKFSAFLPSAGPTNSTREFLPVDDGSWTRVDPHRDYLELLTPVVTSSGANTIDRVLQENVGLWFSDTIGTNKELVGTSNYENDMTGFIEHLVATYMADTLSRIGSHQAEPLGSFSPGLSSERQYPYIAPYGDWLRCNASATIHTGIECSQTPPSPAKNQLKGFTKLSTTFYFKGYAYSLQGGSAIFAIVILSLHMLVALLHVLDLLFVNRWTAACWDTLPELLALAQNSKPADEGSSGPLMHTSAGIKRMKTFAAVARIGVAKEPEGGEMTGATAAGINGQMDQKLMLIFQPTHPTGEVEMDVKY